MKERFYKVLSIVTAVALVFCLLQINSLKNEISSLRKRTDNRNDRMYDNINSIYSNVDSMLKKQASLLADSSWTLENEDIAAGTVNLVCNITPKEHTPDVTSAQLYVNGTAYPMTYKNNIYTAQVPVSIFGHIDADRVDFSDNGTVRTEKLGWSIFPRYDFLTIVHADMSWSGTGGMTGGENGMYCWTIKNGDLHIDISRENMPVKAQSVYLVEMTDGVETKRTRITGAVTGESDSADDGVLISRGNNYINITCSIDDFAFEIPAGGTLELFCEVVDGDGLVHRNQLQRWSVNENGENIDEDHSWWMGGESTIYSVDGRLLYAVDESMYK